jgi:hypothetical protein
MEIIKIGDHQYDVEKLPDNVKTLILDIQKVDGEISRLGLQVSIANFAKDTLLEKLLAGVSTLEKVVPPSTTS